MGNGGVGGPCSSPRMASPTSWIGRIVWTCSPQFGLPVSTGCACAKWKDSPTLEFSRLRVGKANLKANAISQAQPNSKEVRGAICLRDQRPNVGFTCPAMTPQDTASKDFSPHPHECGNAAPPGQVLAGLGGLEFDLHSIKSNFGSREDREGALYLRLICFGTE